jgi:hypothetical protein
MEFWNAKLFLPKWLPDPPPEMGRTVQHWNVVIAGLVTGETVIVQDEAGNQAALLTAVDGDAPSVELRLDLTSRRQDEGTAVGLQRSHTRGTSQREIMMRQSLLTLASSIPLPVPAVGLTLVRGTMIAVADEHGVTMYEVESPPLARAVSHHPAFGLRGVVPWAGGAVAWGSSGLHPIETELELPPETRWMAPPVMPTSSMSCVEVSW